MDSRETHQQQQENLNAAALAGPIYTGALSLIQPQPQPQQPLMLEGLSPYPSARGRRPRTDVVDGGGENVNLPAKRGRGLSPGSVNKQRRNPLGEEGRSLHIINVNAGEDIATKLRAFLIQERRDVYIHSASGTVSTACLQSNSPPGVVKYEGLYNINHMSGTFLNIECHHGTVTITGNLIVSLAGPDGQSVEGCVSGMLIAGSPVTVFVGSLSGGGPGFLQSQGPQFSSEPSEEDGSGYPLPSFSMAEGKI